MKKIKKKIHAATIGLGFGFLHAKVFKKNRFTKLVCVNDFNVKKRKLALFLKTKFPKDKIAITEFSL